MKIDDMTSPDSLEDIGQYFRGLLVVMARDKHLHEEEQKRVRAFGLRCGFSPTYIDENIENVLKNKYLPVIPPRFHSEKTARDFLFEAARVAACDNELHPLETEWLLEAARINDIAAEEMLTILSGVIDSEV